MEDMLDDYLAFCARLSGGDGDRNLNLRRFMEHIHHDAERRWPNVQVRLG